MNYLRWVRSAALAVVLFSCVDRLSVGEAAPPSGGRNGNPAGGEPSFGGSASGAGSLPADRGGRGGAMLSESGGALTEAGGGGGSSPGEGGSSVANAGNGESGAAGGPNSECAKTVASASVSSPADAEQLRGVSEVQGRLVIRGTVANLEALGCLESVGDLEISDAALLQRLDGLGNLKRVGSMQILRNYALTDISGIRSLREIARDLRIVINPELTSLAGLGGITEVPGLLDLLSNEKVESLTALSALERAGSITIYKMQGLTTLDGLEGLKFLNGSLILQQNLTLTSLAALSNLQEVTQLQISESPLLENLVGLEKVQVVQALGIAGNAHLRTLEGLRAPSSLDSLLIQGNPELTSIELLVGLTSVRIFMKFSQLPSLGSLRGLDKLVSIGADDPVPYALTLEQLGITDLQGLKALKQVSNLNIENNLELVSLNGLNPSIELRSLYLAVNPALEDVSALSGLTRLEQDLALMDCDSLTNLEPLQRLTHVRNLALVDNDSLLSLHGLAGLETIADYLRIEDNRALPTCEAVWLLNNLSVGLPDASFTIGGNGTGACAP